MPASDLSVNELKGYLAGFTPASDATLALRLDAAFDRVQQGPPLGCGRRLVPTTVDQTETLTVPASLGLALVPDATAITAATVDGSQADYETGTRDGVITRLYVARSADQVVITGRFGFAAIPPLLKEAIYLIVARGEQERAAGYVDRVTVGEDVAATTTFGTIPRQAQEYLDAYTVANRFVA